MRDEGSINKVMFLAAGVVIALMIIGVIFAMGNKFKDAAEKAGDKGESMLLDMLESDITVYDGNEVSGSEVLNAISKFKNEEFSVWVCTKGNAAGTYYGYNLTANGGTYELGSASSAKIADAKKVTNSVYINPTAKFLGEVLLNANGAKIGVKFVQQ